MGVGDLTCPAKRGFERDSENSDVASQRPMPERRRAACKTPFFFKRPLFIFAGAGSVFLVMIETQKRNRRIRATSLLPFESMQDEKDTARDRGLGAGKQGRKTKTKEYNKGTA